MDAMDNDGFVLELALIAVLIVLNGFFAAAEIALVSARAGRLQALADEGNRRAQSALRLKADPDRFLATVQIGVTVVSTLASAVGGVAAIERIEPWIASIPAPWALRVAEPAAVGIVVFGIAYVSLVAGELVPKALAVRHAEALSLRMAPTIERLSRATRWAIAVLTASSQLVLKVLGRGGESEAAFHTLEDLRAMAKEAERRGVVQDELVTGAVEFHEREVREILTPRTQIRAVATTASLEEALQLLRESGHSRFPVYEGDPDNVIGFVYARDVYETALQGKSFDLTSLVRPALMVPERKAATSLLSEMRKGGIQMALVVDEFGALSGLVTLEDLMEVIVGEIRDEHEVPEEPVKVFGHGAIEVDGGIPIHLLNDDHSIRLPESPDYVTIAGLVLDRMGTLPRPGDTVKVPPYLLTVAGVEGRRISRVRIDPIETVVTNRTGAGGADGGNAH
jgi:putative hemolysin